MPHNLTGIVSTPNMRCTLVLGSHRSGTSVLSRALIGVGVYFGKGLFAPRSDNPKGFFEDEITNQLDESLLVCIERQWNSLLLPHSVDTAVISAYQNSLAENVIRRFEGVPLWGLKDPRISRLWPYWLPVLMGAGIEPIFVLANRHPYSVASSLFTRDQMPDAQALSLWAVHQLDALEALLQHGGLVVDYDRLMDQPREELQRIACFLDVQAQLDPDEVVRFESEFLAVNLRHTRYPAHAVDSAAYPLQALCLEIYGELLRLAELPSRLTPEAVAHARTLMTGFRRELARSTVWMQAIDALQAARAKVPKSAVGSVDSLECEARLYFSEIVDGVPQPYVQSSSQATTYPVSNQRQTLRLQMPADFKPLARIRLDPANRPVALWLHHLALVQADGSELWRWNGDFGSFLNIGGLVSRIGPDGLLLLSLNDDPWFDLAIEDAVLVNIAASTSVVVEMTPRTLLEVVAEVVYQDGLLIAESQAKLKDARIEMTRRDQTISEQSMQIRAMQDELLRAEAQLELLKDLMLDNREKDQL